VHGRRPRKLDEEAGKGAGFALAVHPAVSSDKGKGVRLTPVNQANPDPLAIA
jgi:hypothetical protein